MISEETSIAIKQCLAYDREKLAKRRDALIQAIERENQIIHGGETARVAQVFHLGLVGGSGKAVRKLNKRRARGVDRVIDAAVRWKELRNKLAGIKARIARIDDDTEYKAALARQMRQQKQAPKKRLPHDHDSRIMNAMSHGDCEYTLSDGAKMNCFFVWNKQLKETIAFVALKAPSGFMYLHRARSIQGVHFGETGVALANKYLNERHEIVPTATV